MIYSDRASVYNTNKDFIQEVSTRLDCSLDDVIMAVQEVGLDEDEIEEYIRDRYDRG